ncbi:MAG: hypothetical protein KDE28_14840 [Anaerolineales bacterium]|nr:hypothetical protein [Anaerolineales bacterium]
MEILNLKEKFAQMGAVLDVEFLPERQWARRNRPVTFLLDVNSTGQQERFTLTAPAQKLAELDLRVVDLRPAERHLLLLSAEKDPAGKPRKEKFLCGHDERHWFVAPVPGQRGIANVFQAMEALKPGGVAQLQRRAGVRRKDWQKRRNAGYLRQGEWFFLPQPEFAPTSEALLFAWEPITRPGGQPHLVEELCRIGGETVYVCAQRPRGVNEANYKWLIEHNRKARNWNWRPMRRDPRVWARGKVRHPDHATITLPFWHRVLMSGESRDARVAFLD